MPSPSKKYSGDHSIFHESRNLIAIGKTKDALQLMIAYAAGKDKKYHDAFLKISSGYHQHLEAMRLNIVSDREASIQLSKTNHDLLGLINKMENNEPIPLFSGSLSEKAFGLVLQIYGYLRVTLIFFLLLLCSIFIYFRRDVVKDVFYYGDLGSIYQLFYPLFLLVIVLVLIFYKHKT